MSISCVKQTTFILNQSGANLNPNHIIFTIKDLIDDFFNRFEFLFHKPSSRGRPKTYTDKELLGFTIACDEREITTCRKMEKALKNNDESLNFILNNKKPSKSTIAKFKIENELLINEFFFYTVLIGQEENLIDGEVIGIDGTFLKANAGINNRASRKELKFLKKLLQNITTDQQNEIKKYFKNPDEKNKTKLIKQILKNLNKPAQKLLKSLINSKEKIRKGIRFIEEIEKIHSPKTTYDINLNDPESRFMNDKKGVYGYNYNLQIATDSKNQMIIYCDLNIQNNDYNQLINMIQSSIMSLNMTPSFFTADNGYYTEEGLKYCFNHNINLIIPDRTESQRKNNRPSKKKFPKRDFKHDRINNTFICPQGTILTYKSKRRMNNQLLNVYSSDECLNCKHLKECTANKKREILEPANPIKQRIKDHYYSDKGQQIYKKRAPITESAFGILKRAQNYRGLQRTGREKCLIDLKIEATTYNIKIIHKNRTK